jgi:radical SAM superfamily enzyme YgiQ (UPF0313 family)
MGLGQKLDVLFINPGDRKQIYQDLGAKFTAIEPPVYAGLFATFIRRKGGTTAILDAHGLGMSAKMAAEAALNEYTAHLYVVTIYGYQPSASTQNMTAAGAVARAIKELDPEAKILFTGTHPAALPRRTMQEEAIDFVCDREGPWTILKTVEAVKAGSTAYDSIPSLWWRESDGTIASSKVAESALVDLDAEMPGMAWDLLPMEIYRSHNWHSFDHINDRSPYASIHTTLGCPYRCSFCCINAPFGKPTYRMWSPETVVAEIKFLHDTYGVKNIKIADEMFVLNRSHVLGICDRLIELDLDLNIWAYARIDTVKDEFLDKLRRAGFRWLCLGIESASSHVRDGARKNFKANDIKQVVRKIQAAGIHVLGNYIFGLPDDDIPSMQETLDLAIDLNCEFANFYSAMAYPGSPLYASAVEQDVKLPESWHQFSQHAFDSLPLSNDHCSAAEILRFRDQAWDTYFTNDRYLNMVKSKFGVEVFDHVRDMTALPLQRQLYKMSA